MTQQTLADIPPGTVLEFFESKEVIVGVCLAVKGSRLTVLTEHNREINLAHSRVIHAGGQSLNMVLGRDALVGKLEAVTALRKALMGETDIEEVWSLLEGETEGFDAREVAEFIFSGALTEHHTAAVQRLLFQDRLYFQFKDGKFFPRPQEKVEQRRLEIEREQEREIHLEQSAHWLQALWNRKGRPALPNELQDTTVEALKSFCLFGQESSESAFVRELFKKSNVPPLPSSAFRLLVRLGVWQENENLYLHEQNISAEFPLDVTLFAERVVRSNPASALDGDFRRDLRHLHAFTIDSALTRDYDDALSLAVTEDGVYEVGIHIADAAEFVSGGDPMDVEARERASTIYLPDGRISMLPPLVSEGVCSLKAGEDRLAMSFLLRMDRQGISRGFEIVPSIVKIREQMTYEDVNERVQQEEFLHVLHELALKYREKRLSDGAIVLPLPEIQVYVNSAGMIQISRYEKETPSQIMVSEWMIAANALAASFLSERKIPAIYRIQAECKQESDFTQSDHALFRVFRQRRLFARAELDTKPGMHCSLALPCYTTVTSPIRRYADLAVQRQIKHALLTQSAFYSEEELAQLITKLSATQTKISIIQRKWTRYWILKYIEQEDVHTLDALVLDLNDRFAHLLLPDFLLETNIPAVDKTAMQPGETIRVKIERLNPREDILRLQLS